MVCVHPSYKIHHHVILPSSLCSLSESHANPNEGLQACPSVNQQVFVPLHDATFEQQDDGRSTKREIPELLTALHLLTLLDCRLDAAYHHGPNAHRENASELWAVDRYNLPCVFTVDVKGGSDGLWLGMDVKGLVFLFVYTCGVDDTHVDGVILSGNVRHLPDLSING